MARGGVAKPPPKLNPKTPPDINLLRAKNGLDNGVHHRPSNNRCGFHTSARMSKLLKHDPGGTVQSHATLRFSPTSMSTRRRARRSFSDRSRSESNTGLCNLYESATRNRTYTVPIFAPVFTTVLDRTIRSPSWSTRRFTRSSTARKDQPSVERMAHYRLWHRSFVPR
jgi:hypothetical protein